MGKCSIDLNDYAEDGTSEVLVCPLLKSNVTPDPSIRFIIRTYWETIDGYALQDTSAPEEEVKLRKQKSKKLKNLVRRTSVSLFPTGKLNINGKTYELYEQEGEESADASMSLRSDRARADTDIEFTCDVSTFFCILSFSAV